MTGMQSSPEWSDEEIATLKQSWEQGLTATNIAKKLPGRTRNSIIGKIHRLGVAPRAREVHENPGKIPRKPKTIRKPAVPIMTKPKLIKQSNPPDSAVPFMDMDSSTCKSIEGYESSSGFNLPLYCSNPKSTEASFCPYHLGIYYQRGK